MAAPSSRRRACLALALLPLAGAAQAEPPSVYRLGLRFADDSGHSRELAEWRGRAVILAMAYGACRSLCTTTLRTLEALQAAADAKGVALDFVVVSIDPAEDTPQAWADFRRARRLTRANWTFLCGGADATRLLARFIGVRIWRYDEHLMHDVKVLRLSADGAIAASLDWHSSEIERLL
ncbi:MAG TPA: SCO family protein [Albitalea sp.]|jgi:cytochrome oxidase Cu insertion factor (SCO1/SenC/PrrC family)|nr:SCO family protein [Albitalea sp.]